MRVFFILPSNVLLTDLAGPLDALRYAQNYGAEIEIQLVSPLSQVGSTFGLQLSGMKGLPERLNSGDVLLIPGALDELTAYDSVAGRRIVEWLRKVFDPNQHQILTICSGIFLPAKAGLLRDVSCTTHHSLLADLQAMCPEAKVLENRVFVDQGSILSSAGITAGFDLILYWLSQRFGHTLALNVARNMNIYFRRTPNDTALSPWLNARNHMNTAVHRVQDVITQDPVQNHDLQFLAQIACVSPRHLTRIFKQVTGMTVHDYHLTLKHALYEQWRASGLSQEKSALAAGFSSVHAWRRSRKI